MAVQKKTYTLAEYEQIQDLPENHDKLLELIDGEIVEKVASFTPSEIALTIGTFIRLYLMENRIGRATASDGSYIMSDEDVFIPDVGFISKARLPDRPDRAAPIPPDMAVEVKSPTDSKPAMRRKAEKYLAYGTRLVWLVFPDEQVVEVYIPDRDVETFTIGDILDAHDELPGFTVSVEQIFAD